MVATPSEMVLRVWYGIFLLHKVVDAREWTDRDPGAEQLEISCEEGWR